MISYIGIILRLNLVKFGWIALIMECITSVHFSIIINGQAPLKPCRGLRQEGDPLCPTYLFFVWNLQLENLKGFRYSS